MLFDIFRRGGEEKTEPIPEGFTADDIRVETSTCTGERTIGFYSKADKRLHYSELVLCNDDIRRYCARYGIEGR